MRKTKRAWDAPFYKRILSFLLACMLLLSPNYISAWAAETGKEQTGAVAIDGDEASVFKSQEQGGEEVKEEVKETEDMPAQYFEGTSQDMRVLVDAPLGALPKKSKMELYAVSDEEILAKVDNLVEEDIKNILAVDIIFRDENGNKIEPAKKISVTMKSDMIKDSKEPRLIHIEDNGNTELVEQEESKEADEISFSSERFSIYAIVDTKEKARLKVVFHKENGEEATTIYINKEDVDAGKLDTILYNPAIVDLQEGQVFWGWSESKDYDENTNRLDIEALRKRVKDILTVETIHQDETVLNIYPILFTVAKVTYVDENETVLKTDELIFKKGERTGRYQVDMPYIPPNAEQSFQGWQVKEGLNNIVNPEGLANYKNGTDIEIKGDVVFSVNAPLGHWLIFEENGGGATYNAPQFVKNGQLPQKPRPDNEMERLGYHFEGWYEDAQGNIPYAFDKPLEDNKTIYAKWRQDSRADYSIIIWKQNVSGEGYDYVDSVSLKGWVGSRVDTIQELGNYNDGYIRITADGQSKEYRYQGFYLEKVDKNVEIAPEGNTVVNVYFKRHLITLRFYRPNGYGYYYVQEMRGLYESTLASNGQVWPTDYDWYEQPGRQGIRTTFLDAFKPPFYALSVDFYAYNKIGRNQIRFFKQNLDGSYSWNPSNLVQSGNGKFTITDKYTPGFQAHEYSIDGGRWIQLPETVGASGGYGVVNNYTSLDIHFKRKKYPIAYLDGVYVDARGETITNENNLGPLKVEHDIIYEADVSSYNKGGGKLL